MDQDALNYKIKKYRSKLKLAKNLKSAELYQDKLKYYHRLNQFGGLNVKQGLKETYDYLKDKTDDLLKLVEDIRAQSSFDLTPLDKGIDYLKDKINGLKNDFTNKQHVNQDVPTAMQTNSMAL